MRERIEVRVDVLDVKTSCLNVCMFSPSPSLSPKGEEKK
jgi:hypothetical protein